MTDIFLYPSAVPRTDIILSYGLRAGVAPPQLGTPWAGAGWRGGHRKIRTPHGEPPVAVSLYDDLRERYGNRVGEQVWSKMLVGRLGPFGEGAKYDPDKKRVAKKLKEAGLEELLE